MKGQLLIAQDLINLGVGKPSDFGLGGSTLSFPFPATTAGAVRAAASGERDPFFEMNKAIGGPVLVSLSSNAATSKVEALWLSRPADAEQAGTKFSAMQPSQWPGGTITDLTGKSSTLGQLWPVARPRGVTAKVEKSADANRWWRADSVLKWLTQEGQEGFQPVLGDTLAMSHQTHVSIDSATQTHQVGGLFNTAGVDLGDRHALWIEHEFEVMPNWLTLGGQGHTARIADELSLPWDSQLLEDLQQALKSATFVRVLLTSPAVFEKSAWHPDWLEKQNNGALTGVPFEGRGRWTLRAALLGGLTSYSGWTGADGYSSGPGRPHRVVPAGAVYWFEVPAGEGLNMMHKTLCNGQWGANGWGQCLVGVATAPANGQYR